MTRKLPTGTLTFFFTDIEGSTQLARRLGSGFKDVLNAHNGIVRSAIADVDDGAVEVKTLGDGFFTVFHSADAAVESAIAIQQRLLDYPWPEEGSVRVRNRDAYR